MPGGRGKPKRACSMCKWYKYKGNAKGRYSERETAKREAARKELAETFANVDKTRRAVIRRLAHER